jgi:hypothetical protein
MGKATVSEENKKIQDRLRERQLDDIKELCSTPKGRRVIHYLLRFTGVYVGTAVFGDQTASFFNEGKRSVGLYLMDLVYRADPDLRLQIEREYLAEFLSNKVKLEKAKGKPE